MNLTKTDIADARRIAVDHGIAPDVAETLIRSVFADDFDARQMEFERELLGIIEREAQ